MAISMASTYDQINGDYGRMAVVLPSGALSRKGVKKK